jgi:hypothetical protein
MRIHHSRKSVLGLFLPVLVLVVGAFAASAADVIENMGEGRVNWSLGLVTANGIGAPPKDLKNPAQVRAMTQRAAITVARRNLLEVLKGVRVDSETRVENFIVSSDVIKTQVSGILQGSQVMQTKYFSDGSIEVTVGVYLRGDLASALLPPSLFLAAPELPTLAVPSRPAKRPAEEGSPASMETAVPPAKELSQELTPVASPSAGVKTDKERKGEELVQAEASSSAAAKKREVEAGGKGETVIPQPVPEKGSGGALVTVSPAASPPARSEASKSQPSGAAEQKEERVSPGPPPAPTPAAIIATGLVVDARGLGLKPALLPRILNEGGNEVYGTRQVSRQSALEQGLVGYAKDVSAAQRNIRVTDKPLLVKGVKAVGKEKTDVVIPDPDAATVVTAASGSNFLEKSRVVIVYD